MNRYIIVDTREKPQAIEKILAYFESQNIDYEKSKLLFGDYMDYNRPSIVIDRKKNIEELAKNCTIEHERFLREIKKAQKAGATLYILVEQDRYTDRGEEVKVKNIIDLLRWSSPYTTVRGEKIFRVLASWTAKYPIKVEFCNKRLTGRKIVEILYNGDFRPPMR